MHQSPTDHPSRSSFALWVCRCQCGTVVTVTSVALRKGECKSCGCLRREKTMARCLTHGECRRGKRIREYGAWSDAKSRCYNPRVYNYPRYGGRGIGMADEWRSDYATFLKDMGRCPNGYQLDRIDNDGDYAPGNCRWVPPRTQSNNTRRNIHVGTETLAQFARRHQVNYKALHRRVHDFGMTPHEAVAKSRRKTVP